MKTIRIQLSDSDRTCAVDGEELRAWSTALIDNILFEAAKLASEKCDKGSITPTMTFRVTLAREDGAILIEACGP